MFEVGKRMTDNRGVPRSSGAIMKQSMYCGVYPVISREYIGKSEDHVLLMSCDCVHDTYCKTKIMPLPGKETTRKKMHARMERPGRRVSSAGTMRH